MSAPDSPPCEMLTWDTDFFRCRIGRVLGGTLQSDQAMHIENWARNNRIRCLYFLSRADDPLTIQIAEQSGFGLVDIRVTFECAFARLSERVYPELPSGICIRPAASKDLTGLQAIARTAHTATRFFSDTHFPRQRVEDFYAAWITLELQGRAQTVLIAASAANQPVGYASCHLDTGRKTGQIGLVGVAAEFRGKGVGKNLVLAAMDWFRTHEAREVTVVAQGNNQPAQRLYQQCGFLSRDLQLWYHKWYPISD